MLDNVVAIARSERPAYGQSGSPQPAPELPEGSVTTVAEKAVRDLFRIWGLDAGRFGAPDWNPLAELIPPSSRVTIKPNWVLHFNQSGQGLDCLVTHTSVIEAVGKYVALTKPAHLTIGDAPVQGCNFSALRNLCDIDGMAERLRQRGMNVSIVDFRRTLLPGRRLGEQRSENMRSMDHFVLTDLSRDSLLEPISADASRFRVTMYNPDLLQRTHGPGKHQYLIAREILDADVVINVPKLKSHKKSCITGALKNMIGMNGNKEYLPHHRKGGGSGHGDCYAGDFWLKNCAEDLLDASNRRDPGPVQGVLAKLAEIAGRVAARVGDNDNLEGSWYGNDTIWRTCLDLQRILYYGTVSGKLTPSRQRQVITITDAIIGGQGEGPLANTPIGSAFITGGLSTAAVEWCHARLMGFDPLKVPLVREAFGTFPFPIAEFRPEDISVRTDSGATPVASVLPLDGMGFTPPSGWQGFCELGKTDDSTLDQPTLVA